MVLQYDYSKPRKLCESKGMVFLEQLVPQSDKHFNDYHFTQKQVDAAFELHIWAIEYIFTPQNYSFWQRIGLAIYFLFGKKK